MRSGTTMGVVALTGALALGACGGTGGRQSAPNRSNLGRTGRNQDADAVGPVTISGAQKGGIVTVLTHEGLSTTLDPSEIYNVDTSSIFSGLIGRSLTQYKYDATSKQMILVPDLATDLGQSNDDFTRWTFTIRRGVKWGENGKAVSAQDVAWGMTRCMDAATFPIGACQYYSNAYFKGGEDYQGPYTSGKRTFKGIKVEGNKITITMAKPFPDMPYWASFPANGPVPQDPKVSNPKDYKEHPWSTGPYMIKSYSPAKKLVLEKNPNWNASTDPARTQYPDGYDFESQETSDRIDQILLADSGPAQTTLTYDDLLAPDFQQMKQKAPDRLTLGGSPCTRFWAPDNRKITNKLVREALSWAYPYQDVILASGLIPGVNAIPATNLMPPAVPGRTPYNVTGRQGFDTDPAKARALLKSAHALGYEIKFLYRSDQSGDTKVKDAVVKGLTEGGFTAIAVPTHLDGLQHGGRQHERGHQPARGRLVLGLAVRVDLAAGAPRLDEPGQDPLVRGQLRGLRQQVRGRPDGCDRTDAAGPAAGRLERPRQAGSHEVLPAVHDLLRRDRRGARVEDPGRLR